MACCCPPWTAREPMSTFTRSTLTPLRLPVISCPQPPPSRSTCVSCASICWIGRNWVRASVTASPTNCSARFKCPTSVFASLATSSQLKFHVCFGFGFRFCPTPITRDLRPQFLINFRQLRQQCPRLRLDVLARILRRQRHQNAAHAAVSLHRLQHAQSFGAHARIGIVDQRLQQAVAHPRVVFYVRAKRIQSFETYSRVRIVLQRIHQRVAEVRVAGVLRHQADGIHAHAGVVVIARCIQQQLLNALIVERSLRFLRRRSVVFDGDLIRARRLGYGFNASNGCVVEGSRSRCARLLRRVSVDLLCCSHSAGEAENQNDRSQRGRETHLPQPCRRIERQTAEEAALLYGLEPFL